MFDAQLTVRTGASGSLTVTESGPAKEIRGTGIRGMALRVVIPTAYNDADNLLIQVYVSPDNSTYSLLAQRDLTTLATNPGEYILPFTTPYKYAKHRLAPAGNTIASVDFGAVQAGFVLGVGYDWDRAVSFE